MEKEKVFTKEQQLFIELLSDGYQLNEAVATLSAAPFDLSAEIVTAFYKDADILQAIVETANNKLGQAWGTMWRKIKEQAMLGSVAHSKLLIDFMQNKKVTNLGRLNITFENDDDKDTP